MRRWLPVGLAVLLCLGLPGAAAPQQDDLPIARADEARVLCGLPGVEVLIEQVRPDATRDGLTQDDLRTEVELTLRQSGIRVLTEKEDGETPGNPTLYLNVNCVKVEDAPCYAYSQTLELQENVHLERARPDGQHLLVIGAGVWKRGSTGFIGLLPFAAGIKEVVKAEAEQFCNDYLAANPKPAAQP